MTHTIGSIIIAGINATCYITGSILDMGYSATWCAKVTILSIHVTEPVVTFFLTMVIADHGLLTRSWAVTIVSIIFAG